MDVCLVVRVHDRVADLRVCLDAVRRHWRRHRYHVVVASNGRAAGHPVRPLRLLGAPGNHFLGGVHFGHITLRLTSARPAQRKPSLPTAQPQRIALPP